jgi:hypothetical protein
VKERWGVAISAMVYRCKDLDVLSKTQLSYLMRQMNARGIRIVEPMDNLFRVGRPSVLAEALNMLVNNGVQTKAQIEGAIPINLADVESLCGVPKGYLDTRVVHLSQRPRLIQT